MFTRGEFDEIQRITTEALSYMLQPFTLLRLNKEESDIDDFYNETKYTTYDEIIVEGAINDRPKSKVLEKYGLREGNTIQIEVPKEYLTKNKEYIGINDKVRYKETIYVIRRLFTNAEFPIIFDYQGERLGTDYLTVVILAEVEKTELGEGKYGYIGYKEDGELEQG